MEERCEVLSLIGDVAGESGRPPFRMPGDPGGHRGPAALGITSRREPHVALARLGRDDELA